MTVLDTPPTPERIYANGSILEPGDLNNWMAAIVQLWGGRRGPRPRKLHIATGQVVAGGPGTFNSNGSYTASLGSDVLVVPIDVESGERILGLRARVDPAASGAVAVNLLRVTDGSITVLGSPGASSGASVQTIAVSGLTPEVVADAPGVEYLASFAFSLGGGHVVLSGDFSVDRLAP